MRNLLQYPITYDELLSDLATARDWYNPEIHGIGGTEGVSLDMLQLYLTANEAHVTQFLATMQGQLPERPTPPPGTIRRECVAPGREAW
jgi:hypothetical protein